SYFDFAILAQSKTMNSTLGHEKMKQILVILILVVLLMGMTGCGTCGRNRSSARVYPALHVDGMIYRDYAGIWKETRDTTTPGVGGDNSVGQFIAYTGFILTTVDVPISLVTDTILLPYDLWIKDRTMEPQQPDAEVQSEGAPSD
ncbi:YceK/YidQ family lipoprotein, partial [Verrucomicrobiota bacterium]